MRVPAALRARHGRLVRVNLQTADRDIARVLAASLAAQWLARFSGLEASLGVPCAHLFAPTGANADAPAHGRQLLADARAPAAPPVEPCRSLTSQDANPSAPLGAGASQGVTALHSHWRGLVPTRPERTVIEFETTATSFDKVIAVPVSQMTRADVATYRDHLISQGLQPATVVKRLGHLSAMLQTYVDAGRLERNVAQRMRVPRTETTQSPLPFGTEHLAAIFGSPLYASHQRYRAGGGEAAAWVPVLGLTTGARLEELCQLRLRDIKVDPSSGAFIDITGDGLSTRVKTRGSNRVVPVHPELERVGFLRYIAQCRHIGHDWLFPDLRVDRFGHRSGNFGKWFGRYLRDPEGCGISDARLVFHSFRHCFKTLCRRAKIAEEAHDFLTGHAGGSSAGVGRRYGIVPLELLVEAVRSIALPIELPVICR